MCVTVFRSGELSGFQHQDVEAFARRMPGGGKQMPASRDSQFPVHALQAPAPQYVASQRAEVPIPGLSKNVGDEQRTCSGTG